MVKLTAGHPKIKIIQSQKNVAQKNADNLPSK